MSSDPHGFTVGVAGQQKLAARPAAILQEILGEDLDALDVSTLFQPIIDLSSMGTVGFEALTRGPAGSRVETPVALFGAARESGRLAEFDRACRDAALARAALAGLRPPFTVFVNVEPELVEDAAPAAQDTTWREAPSQLRCCIEITERALMSRPRELLNAVAGVRDLSWGVALDDLGADPDSLALMCLLRPDVVKLDMRLVHEEATAETAQIVAAVSAHVEETGALVVAEGIETERHLHTALALGASHGQGWRFGRPAPLPEHFPPGGPQVHFFGAGGALHGPTPLSLLRGSQTMRRGDEPMLRSMLHHLETQAAGLGAATIVLASHPAFWESEGSLQRLDRMADTASLVGVLGAGRGDGHLRVTPLPEGDLLRDEVVLTVLAPHFAGAIVAVRLGTETPEPVYEFGVTHDREIVAQCARALAGRLVPLTPA